MTTALDSLPDITRSDVNIAVVKRWDTSIAAAEQRASADALTQASGRTPPPGLLTISRLSARAARPMSGLLRGIQANHGPTRTEGRG